MHPSVVLFSVVTIFLVVAASSSMSVLATPPLLHSLLQQNNQKKKNNNNNNNNHFSSSCDYDCTRVPGAPAPGNITHISQLRPCDIVGVGALGDSITAAFAAKNEIWEFRELSFPIGAGKSNPPTFFNFLREINPKVVGGSPVSHIPELRGAPHDPLQDVENVAQSEGRCEDLSAYGMAHLHGKGYQLKALRDEMKSLQDFGKINIEKDWKFLNIFIVANDVCSSCEGDRDNEAFFRLALNETLAEIQRTIPRIFVSVMTSFTFGEQLYKLWETDLYCMGLHSLVSECSCLAHHGAAGRQKMDANIQKYNKVIMELTDFWASKNIPDFTTVAQTYAQDFQIPSLDWVANKVDCFHPSALAHAQMAVGLWNDVLTPIAQKTYPMKTGEKAKCPADNARFYST